MKTIIAEKMMLLIVIGSQVLELIGAWGRSGIVVGSFGRTILLMVAAEKKFGVDRPYKGSQLRASRKAAASIPRR
jgi:hypothetical protein